MTSSWIKRVSSQYKWCLSRPAGRSIFRKKMRWALSRLSRHKTMSRAKKIAFSSWGLKPRTRIGNGKKCLKNTFKSVWRASLTWVSQPSPYTFTTWRPKWSQLTLQASSLRWTSGRSSSAWAKSPCKRSSAHHSIQALCSFKTCWDSI